MDRSKRVVRAIDKWKKKYDPLKHVKLNDVDDIELKRALEIIKDRDYYPLPGGDNEV